MVVLVVVVVVSRSRSRGILDFLKIVEIDCLKRMQAHGLPKRNQNKDYEQQILVSQ